MTESTGKLSPQSWMVSPETREVMSALMEDGGEARFVGGCVRDALANRRVMDIDIATTLKPTEVIERLTRRQISYVPTGLKHGTVTAVVEGHPFEITTLRRDVATDGRHAEVAFTTDWKADAARRDFTMNTIFATMEGAIYDYFGGVGDLRRGLVRFVGDPEKRIQEDVLRILRFFRFYAHFGKGAPDPAALRACAAAAPQISRLSGERIRQEILKLLESDHCPAVWKIMQAQGIAAHVLPDAANIENLERLVALEAEYHIPGSSLRRLAALLGPTENGARHAATALKLSNDQVHRLLKFASPGVDISVDMTDMALRRSVYLLGNDMTRNILLLRAAQSAHKGRLGEIYHMAAAFRPPSFPLEGEDVLNLGHTAGPEIGRILRVIEDWWIASDFAPGRTECLQKLEKDFRPA